jgi:ribosomal protein L21E
VNVSELSNWSRPTLYRSEAALFLDCDPRTLDRAIADGTIQSFRVGKRVHIPIAPFIELVLGRRPSDV